MHAPAPQLSLETRKPEQLELPFLEISNLKKYRVVTEEDIHQLSRTLDGGLTKDFNCAIPKDFPEAGEYQRERIYRGSNGQIFTKRYILRGNFKESDESERVLLTAYWKVVDGQNKAFRFSLGDYFRFKNIDTHSGENVANFKNYLERTRRNEWKLNCWFNYATGKFQEERSYGVIQEFVWTKAEIGGVGRIIVGITWSDAYYEVFREGKNWKYFDMNRFVEIPEQSQLTKKFLLFLANENNEFMKEYGECILVKIDLKTLCEFYLAMPEAPIWRYRDRLGKPLLTLKKLGLLHFNKVEECFIKEGRTAYLILTYLPPNVPPQQKIKYMIKALSAKI